MRRKISLLLNVLMAVLALRAWLSMTFNIGADGILSASGLSNLRYFTVLSNLLQAGVSIASAIALIGLMLKRRSGFSRGLLRWRYAAAVSVAVTFFTVLCFLGPVFGYAGMFAGANLWLHLIVPVMSMLDFCLVEREGTIPLKALPIAMLPMLAYGLGYVANIAINGLEGNDWYGFVRGGPASIAIAFMAMSLATALIALILRLPRRGSAER